jgi:hypothetical protein
VQGSSRLSLRVRFAATFATAFLMAALGVFACTFLLGSLAVTQDVARGWRQLIAAAGLTGLAAVDVVAIRRATYCPVGLARQTPKVAMRKFSPVVTAGIWGVDTGLVVTTYRVAAITWGALVLVFLGLSGWQIGVGYGTGFVVPLMCILWTSRVADWALLEKLLRCRAAVQVGSAALLTTGGMSLLFQSLSWLTR